VTPDAVPGAMNDELWSNRPVRIRRTGALHELLFTWLAARVLVSRRIERNPGVCGGSSAPAEPDPPHTLVG